MKLLSIAVACALVLLCSMSASGQNINSRQTLMTATQVATGSPVTVTIDNIGYSSGYLIVKTENETATASLVVTVTGDNDLGDISLCTTDAITTNTTEHTLLGAMPGVENVPPDIENICDFPLTHRLNFTFTVTGVGADFDVSADFLGLVR